MGEGFAAKGKVETALIGCEIWSERKMRDDAKRRRVRSENVNPRLGGVRCQPAGGWGVNPVRGERSTRQRVGCLFARGERFTRRRVECQSAGGWCVICKVMRGKIGAERKRDLKRDWQKISCEIRWLSTGCGESQFCTEWGAYPQAG